MKHAAEAATGIDRQLALSVAISASRAAAEVVMRIYAEAFDVEFKGKDDPVTRADREANALICAEIQRSFPSIPIVAEESDPASFGAYATADAAWFVDPLDGTKEFIAKNGEFAVMIGLAERGRASVGVVLCPARKRLFAGIVGEGAWEIDENGARKPLSPSTLTGANEARVVISRSHKPPAVDWVLEKLGASRVTPTGSCGLKSTLVAAGEADLYFQPGRIGKRWDTCAPEAILRAAGGELTDAFGTLIDYQTTELDNTRGILACTPGIFESVKSAIAAALAEHA